MNTYKVPHDRARGITIGWTLDKEELKSSAVFLHQEHSAVIQRVGEQRGEYRGDGLIIRNAGVQLVVQTADCVPLFLYASSARVIGVVHAGWRGTEQNISGIMAEKLKRINKETDTLFVVIGHCIRQCHYEVQEDVADQFRDYSGALIQREGKMYLDLVEVNRQQLIAAGVTSHNIIDAGECTYCNPALPSYRRDGKGCARIYHWIVLL